MKSAILKKKFYVYEFGERVYKSDHFNIALHEMLSLLLAKAKYLNKTFKMNPDQVYEHYYMQEIYDTNDDKKYNYVIDSYKFDLETRSVVDKNSKKTEMDQTCLKIFEEILAYDKFLNNQHITFVDDYSLINKNPLLFDLSQINKNDEYKPLNYNPTNLTNQTNQTNKTNKTNKINQNTIEENILETGDLLNQTLNTLNALSSSYPFNSNNNANIPNDNVSNDNDNDNVSNDNDNDNYNKNINNYIDMFTDSETDDVDFKQTPIEKHETDETDQTKLENIIKQIETLKQIKEIAENKISIIKDIHDNNVTDFVDKVADVNYAKKMEFKNRERENERRNKFSSAKKIFFKLKKDIKNPKKKMSEDSIPALFINSYKVLNYMFDNKLLSESSDDYNYDDNEYHVYWKLYDMLTENDYIPIVSPIGVDNKGNTLNLNADTVAGDIAGKVNAEKLIILTDVPGILEDPNDPETLIKKVKIDEINDLIENGIVNDGMIPKVETCLNAIENGVHSAHIIDGRIKHSALLEIFTKDGIGTMISR